MLLEDLHIVIKVAECGSITAAAKQLDMRTATASAALKRVEASLGMELFVRSTRRLRLSSAGERYLPQCQQALALLDQARGNVLNELDLIDGEVRIALSSDLGRNVVSPWLDEFMQQYSKLSLRCNISDSKIDFYRDSVDMALRYGSPADASSYGFKICDVPKLLCASPTYLQARGTPKTPAELAKHNCLFYQLHDVLQDEWSFDDGQLLQRFKLSGDRASNDGDQVRRWCVAGHGLALKSCLDVAEDLLSGRLHALMPDYVAPPTELWLLCPSKQSITPTLRLLRDFFREKTAHVIKQLHQAKILSSPTSGAG
ncbi:LysR family transcriptional regulator [Agaribacterium haliotis]|uniref:LysR family transcriptional regulator n=1 Tax=Agaribacterium haliotis TaxID=2013869 RepID=UPI000BB53490|nr:LysR family transcriptional regulator [Agaribacterium haliotis]